MKDPAWIETVPETDWDKDTYLSVLLEKVKDLILKLPNHIIYIKENL